MRVLSRAALPIMPMFARSQPPPQPFVLFRRQRRSFPQRTCLEHRRIAVIVAVRLVVAVIVATAWEGTRG
jgi:hypothetical protein